MITSISASTPAPVAADPKQVGWARACRSLRDEVGRELGVELLDDERVAREPVAHRLDHTLGIGTDAIDLVDEQQRGHAKALQRAHQHDRLRLHTLDGGQHQHRAVEHGERPFDLRDEVRVARGVDDVHGQVADREGDDRGPDRDAALTFERQRVGLCRSLVDAAGAPIAPAA